MSQRRVLLTDDHKLMRTGLRLVVEQHRDFWGEADDGRQATALAGTLNVAAPASSPR